MSETYRDLDATWGFRGLQPDVKRGSINYNSKGVSVLRCVLVILFLSGCAMGAPVDKDFLGNTYPAECKDVSDVHIAIRMTTPDAMRQLTGFTKRRHLYSVWLQYTFKPHEIWIDKTITGARLNDLIRHEKCHEKMWLLTGDGAWHPK